MNDDLHDIIRQFRILIRNIKYSRLLMGKKRDGRVQDRLEHVYRVTNRFLYSLDIDYWLVYGTLLGFHRNERLIKGDRDVDFGAHEKEYGKIWQARHQLPRGFRMYNTSRNHYGPKLYVTYQGWEADIYFYKDKNGLLQSYEKSRNIGDMQPFPREFIYPLKAVDFLGDQTHIPNDPKAYLLHTYHYIGEDAVRDPKTGYWYKSSG